MVQIREEQLGNITVLDEDQDGDITASDATLANVAGVVHVPLPANPGDNSFWVSNDNPSLPKFTDSDGVTVTLGSGGGGGDGYIPAVKKDGVTIATSVESLNFVGGGVSVTASGGQANIIVGGISPAPTLLYVNNSTGNDNNNGSISSPLLTLDAALTLVGPVVRNTCDIILVAPGNYPTAKLAEVRTFIKFLSIVGDDSLDVTPLIAQTVTDGYFQTVTTIGGYTSGAYAGMLLRVTSGAQSGQVRRVLGNTANTFTLLDGFSTNLVPGDTFEIFYPGVTIVPSVNPSIYSDDNASLGLINVELPSATFIQGIPYFDTVSIPTSGTFSSSSIYGSGFITDNLRGFGWRKSGAASIGSMYFNNTAVANGYIAGYLGRVSISNSSGFGHATGIRLFGRMGLDCKNSDIDLGGYASYQATEPTTYLDNFQVLDRPYWQSGGFTQIVAPINVVNNGGGGEDGRFMMREMAYVELGTTFINCPLLDMAQNSLFRIASVSNGNITDALVDDTLNSVEPQLTFNAVGDSIAGSNGSRLFRTN